MTDGTDLSPVKRRLLEQWLADAMDPEPAPTPSPAPMSRAEQDMADVWRDVLRVERVGPDDDYFGLGGDSITAIVVVARAARLGLDFTAYELFEHPTVRRIVAAARRADPAVPSDSAAAGPPSPADARPEAGLPLGPLQQGMLYHALSGSRPGAYLVQVSATIIGRLDAVAFEAAWQAVSAANPALRSCFLVAGRTTPVQVVRSGLPVPFEVHDLTGIAPATHAATVDRLQRADRERGFDLAVPPLLRVTLIREGPKQHYFLLTYHHLLFDGWSQQLVLRDVLDCYRRLVAGEPAAPTARPPFTDFAGRDRPADPDLVAQLASRASRTLLAGATAAPGSLADRAEQVRTLPADLTTQLDHLARDHRLTIGTLVHGAWGLVLADRCGRPGVTFGSTVAGRAPERVGITECIGMFVRTLPLNLSCPSDVRVAAWLAGVRTELARLHGAGTASLSRIERVAGVGPLFDSIVVVENFPTTVTAGDSGVGFVIEGPGVYVDEGYPIVLEVTPATEMVLRARHDPDRLDTAAATALLDAVLDALRAVAEDVDARLAEVFTAMARARHTRSAAAPRAGRRRPAAATRRGRP